ASLHAGSLGPRDDDPLPPAALRQQLVDVAVGRAQVEGRVFGGRVTLDSAVVADLVGSRPTEALEQVGLLTPQLAEAALGLEEAGRNRARVTERVAFFPGILVEGPARAMDLVAEEHVDAVLPLDPDHRAVLQRLLGAQ